MTFSEDSILIPSENFFESEIWKDGHFYDEANDEESDDEFDEDEE